MKNSLAIGIVLTAIIISFMNMTSAVNKSTQIKIKNNADLEEMSRLKKDNLDLRKQITILELKCKK